jgi:hypothetical protein
MIGEGFLRCRRYCVGTTAVLLTLQFVCSLTACTYLNTSLHAKFKASVRQLRLKYLLRRIAFPPFPSFLNGGQDFVPVALKEERLYRVVGWGCHRATMYANDIREHLP